MTGGMPVPSDLDVAIRWIEHFGLAMSQTSKITGSIQEQNFLYLFSREILK